ncbi:MAG: BlaI/MecI/CopY family transcriptional regulator [Gemmatimonadota bacterium]|nr:BlaI/MecI/CopY family transcriptional regulator [Gemmatimonadota bacterium]
MPHDSHRDLSRRERQIMDILYRRGRATAQDVMAQLPDPPSYSAVRAMLRLLEERGQVKHEQVGPRYVFTPTVTPEKARKSALRNVVRTFFDGSTRDAVAALLDLDDARLTPTEIDRLKTLIDRATSEGR